MMGVMATSDGGCTLSVASYTLYSVRSKLYPNDWIGVVCARKCQTGRDLPADHCMHDHTEKGVRSCADGVQDEPRGKAGTVGAETLRGATWHPHLSGLLYHVDQEQGTLGGEHGGQNRRKGKLGSSACRRAVHLGDQHMALSSCKDSKLPE